MMDIAYLGLDHHVASLVERERLLSFIREHFPDMGVLMVTCNRVELYATESEITNIPRYFDCHYKKGFDAFIHLCRVAASLESAIFGEDDIQRQIRESYGSAKKVAAPIHYAFQQALRLGKIVRSSPLFPKRTKELSQRVVTEIENRNLRSLFFLGQSRTNHSILRILEKSKYEISLCSRSLWAEPGCKTLKWDELLKWEDHECLIAATITTTPIITEKRGGDRSVIFDLGMPRNIGASLQNHPGVTLFNIDQLHEQKIEGHEEKKSIELLVEAHAKRAYDRYAQKLLVIRN